jgi:mono/diheme cytochrome c family protein
MRTITMVACACLVVMSGVTAKQQQNDRDREWIAPRGAASMQNPLENRPDTDQGGRKLFQHRCSLCHGEDGTGTNRGPNLTLAQVQNQSDGAFFWKISSGNTRTGMPGFSFLPRLQRWQLVKHLRTLGEPTPSRSRRKPIEQ